MSSLRQALVSWEQFQELSERPESGQHYELRDGEVVVVPPAHPRHSKIQRTLQSLLEKLTGDYGEAVVEFPYRPQADLQFWFADVALVSKAVWESYGQEEHGVYSPPLIAEVLSPSNNPRKVEQQSPIALAAGTQEFWVIDPDAKSIRITGVNGTRIFAGKEPIPVMALKRSLDLSKLFI